MRPELSSLDRVFMEPTLIDDQVIKSIISQCKPKCKRTHMFEGFKVVKILSRGKILHSYFSFLNLDSEVYALGPTLGKGAYGKVKLGLNLRTGLKIAIKVQTGSRRRDVQKQTALTRDFGVGHAGEVCGPFYDEETSYIVLPLAKGSLRNYFNRGVYTLKQIYIIIYQIAIQLQELHASGRVHLDLRPDNILMFGDDAYIADFGLCMTAGIRLYGLNEPPLKYKWAPPERFMLESCEVQPSIDLYGLGYVVSWFVPKFDDRVLKAIQERLMDWNPAARGTLDEVESLLETAIDALAADRTCHLTRLAGVEDEEMPASIPAPLVVKEWTSPEEFKPLIAPESYLGPV